VKPKIWGQSKSLPKKDFYLSTAAEYTHTIDLRQRILGNDLASDFEGKKHHKMSYQSCYVQEKMR
jgi:hypothetical protein